MSNNNTNLQTQTSNALYNAIMEAGGKDRPPMLAPGSSKTTTKGYTENYRNVPQEIRDQLNAEAEAVQIILTWIDNDIYSTVDACPNASEIKFTSRDGESLDSYYSRFYKMMNELVRNQCDVTNHQVNVQFLLQLQPEWQRFVTLVKQSQELKTVSYHKLYDILKQRQYEVNEIRAERITSATKNRGKVIVNSSTPTYDQEPTMVADDDEMSKENEIDKLMDLISISFKKIYKPTNNNLKTSSNTSKANQDNSPRINRRTGYENHECKLMFVGRENVVYHKEKMLLCKQEEVGFQLNADQADWRDDTDDEPDYQELEAHYMYMAQLQEVTPDTTDNSGPIFDSEPLQEVQNDDDHYNVFANNGEHPVQPKPVNDTYLEEQSDTNITIDSLDMSTNGEIVDEDDDDLANEHLKKFQAELDRYHDVNYASKVDIDCAKAKGDLIFVKPEFLKKAQRANPRLYDIGCYNDNLALMLAPESDETIHLGHESRSKLKEMVADLRYFNSLEHEVDSLKTQLETQKTQFLNEIDLLFREYYYADHMNAILGVYTTLDAFTDLQCDYVDQVVKCECLEKEL
ncbi:hypothetical protein Tco_1198931 [Tanacetum coccineum]